MDAELGSRTSQELASPADLLIRPQPMLARVGQVLYWIGCAIGFTALLVAIWLFTRNPSEPGLGIRALAFAMTAWVAGHVIRRLLSVKRN